MRNLGRSVAEALPKPLEMAARRAEEFARGFVAGGTLFDELGFYYVGPVDGHNLDHLLPVLKNARDSKLDKPILIHVVTKKGKGYPPAEASADKYHGVVKFDVVTGKQAKPVANAPAYQAVFAKALIAEAEADKKIVAITAAMPSGTSLDKFAERFPERTLRRRHRRAAWRHLRRRPRHARASSRSRRSTRPSCSAPTTRWCTTSPSRSCRCASPSIAPAWSAPTAPPTRARSTSPISPACRTSW